MKSIKKATFYKGGIILTIIAILFVIACCLWPKSYDEMIPAQAKAVLCLDNETFGKMLSIKDKKQLSNALNTDAFDLSVPIYGVVTPNEYLCILAKVKDGDKVKGFLNRFEEKHISVDEYDGRKWAWLADGWLASWDGRSFICIGPGMVQERDILRQTITSMIDTGDKFINTPAYANLMKQEKPLKFFAQLDAIPAPYNMLFRFNIPAECDLAAVQVFASANLTLKGTDVQVDQLDCNITSENDDIVAAINAYEKEKGCIEVNKQIGQGMPLFSLATNTKGNPLLQLLKTDATLRGLLMGLNQTFDADRLLGSTDGLFCIEIDSFSKDWTPSFCLKAETHTTNLLADADYWLECAQKQKNVTLKRKSSNDFFIDSKKQQLNFGLTPRLNELYFASPSMLNRAKLPFAFKQNNKKEGTLVYFNINIDLLKQQPCMKDGNAAAIINKLLPSNTHKVCYEAVTGRKATLKFD